MYSKCLCFPLLLFFLFIGCKSSDRQQDIFDPPTSNALPEGMYLVWEDDFNGTFLDRDKWSTHYYSIWDFMDKTNYEDFRADNLPQPAMEFTGHSIILKTDEKEPERAYWKNGRKISSIQTYDWNADKSYLDNRVGGFFEARIKRNATDDAQQVNGAFWFDSPGPDLKYYMEEGNSAFGVEGIRPRGQVFEIDMCEYLTTELVLHGNVSPDGEFEGNIGHHIEKGDFKDKWVVHSLLWTPAGLKFYLDGKLIKEWWDPNDIKSPNHMMNMFLGAYGNGGKVTLEADYIRYYQWELEPENKLPNPGFEYNGKLFPWEGKGEISESDKRSGKYGLILLPGDSIYQYVYVDHSRNYRLGLYGKGSDSLNVKVENITQVTGKTEDVFSDNYNLKNEYNQFELPFTAGKEYGNHMRTVKVTFTNQGTEKVLLDDLSVTEI